MNGRHGIRRRLSGRLAGLVCTALLFAFSRGASAQFAEYEVKAVFLSNFSQFVKWPDKSFADESAPFVIGIAGDDPFGGALERAVRGQAVGGHKIILKHGRKADDLRGCQIVFISKSEKSRTAEIVSALQGSVLTVGEGEDFTRQGGIIGFFMDGGKVRFDINRGAAQRANLQISSRLIKISK